MTLAPSESFVELPAGRFRTFTWGEGQDVIFLHGLDRGPKC